MAMIRFSPLEEMSLLRNQIDRLFDPISSHGETPACKHLLPVEVTERANQYIVKLLVPGLSPEQIQIEGTQKELIVTAEIKPRELEKEETVHLNEFHYGKFSRHLSFPQALATEQIEAEYECGVLKITIPKQESVQRKAIEIKVNQK